jgi:hypothetical protein
LNSQSGEALCAPNGLSRPVQVGDQLASRLPRNPFGCYYFAAGGDAEHGDGVSPGCERKLCFQTAKPGRSHVHHHRFVAERCLKSLGGFQALVLEQRWPNPQRVDIVANGLG